MSLSFPLFAMVFFFSNVAFLALKGVFFIYGIFKGRHSQIDVIVKFITKCKQIIINGNKLCNINRMMITYTMTKNQLS